MTIFSKLLVGAAGVSMAALSASAGAQGYYPPPPPTPYNQGYNQQSERTRPGHQPGPRRRTLWHLRPGQ